MKDLININNCKYLIEMNKNEMKDLIFDAKEYDKTGQLYTWSKYYKSVVSYLHRVIKNKGIMYVDYEFSKESCDGRQYSTTFGLQSLQKDLKNFIIDDKYIDFDQVNSHFTLLSYICKKNNINCDTIDHYVRERSTILNMYNITKQRVLVLLNQDVTSPRNVFEKKLCAELLIIKPLLIDIYDLQTTNTKNPISSKINKLICNYENEVLMLAVNKLTSETYTLCFDGFLTIDKTITIEMLNELTVDYGIKWSIKKPETKIIMPDNFTPSEVSTSEYFEMKTKFELNNCLLLSPYVFLRRYEGLWNMYSMADFKGIYHTMPKVLDPFSTEGKYRKFIDVWIDDFKRLTFEKMDFFPYNKNALINPNPKIKNTFQEFTRINNTAIVNESSIEYITNLKKLIYNLAEANDELALFLTKWIAHIIQYPECIPESVICLKGNGGNGKDSLVELIQNIINNPKYICRTDKPAEVFGSFNSVLENKLLVALNEASGSDAVKYLENMKNVVTSTTVNIHRKGKEIQTIKSYIRLIILSNNNKPICKDADDRRYCVMTTTDELKCDSTFFEPFYQGMKDENILDNVFNYFNNIDLTDFKPNEFPESKAAAILVEDSIKPIVSFLYEICLSPPEGFFYDKNNNIYIKSIDFRYKFISYCKLEGHSFEFTSSGKKIIMELSKFENYIKTKAQKCILGKNGRYIIINYKSLLEYFKTTIFKNHDDVYEEVDVKPVCVVNDDDSSDDDDSLHQF
jgi:hypothetical protein